MVKQKIAAKKIYLLACILMIFLVINIPVTFAKIVAGMEPIRTHDVTIKKRDTGGNVNTALDLSENEMVILDIHKVDGSIYEEPFQQSLIYHWNDTDVTVDLIPGKYEVEGQLLLDEDFVIPEDKRTFCKGLTGGWSQTGSTLMSLVIGQGLALGLTVLLTSATMATALQALSTMLLGPVGWVLAAFILAQLIFDCVGKEETMTIDSINLSIVPVGGVALTNSTGAFWRIDGEELDSRNETTFYVFYTAPPVLMEQFGGVGLYEDYSKRYKNLAMPE